MSKVPLQPHSPTSFCNFIIPYDNDVGHFEKEGLLKFIQENSANIHEADCSFFPRAVTDLDVDVENILNGKCKEQILQASEKVDNYSEFPRNMDSQQFQPDLVISNSQQRAGPDGSPALCPPKSQGQVNFSNLSETGELFAPVRTLTFSDVESSHVEDSYINSSRLVSTPEHAQTGIRNLDYRNSRNQHAEDIITVTQPGGQRMGNHAEDSDSRESSPEFRQLDGEDENELLGTGTFKPTFHGINQEFLEHFTGKKGPPNSFSADIFSPLGGMQHRGVDNERKTPPLHSPGANSPFARHMANQGVVLTRHVDKDDNEIQFLMSPHKNSTSAYVIKEVSKLSPGKQPLMTNHMRENSFQPIYVEHQNHMMQMNIPRNLNEYLEANNSDQDLETEPELDRNLRQGDGVEVTDDKQTRHLPEDVHFDRQFSEMSEADFEQRYLRRTQVSVKLPQATYDTMTNDVVLQDSARQVAKGLSYDHLEEEIQGENLITKCDYTTDSQDGKVTQVVVSGSSGIFVESSEDIFKSKKGVSQSMEKAKMRDSSNVTQQKTMHSLAQSTDQQTQSASSKIPVSLSMTGSSDNATSRSTSEIVPSKTSSNQQPHINHGLTNHSHVASQPSSRLLQETISQRNKTTQKYLSNAPGVSKTTVNPTREFKKPIDYLVRNSGAINSGIPARKTGEQETSSVCPKFSEKQKFKSVSTEHLNQKQPKTTKNPARMPSLPSQQNKLAKQQTNLPSKSQTHHEQAVINHGEGEGTHNVSSHSVEDLKGEPRVVTQVQNTSPFHEHKASTQSIKVQQTGDQSVDVQGVEDVRAQLQNMLKLSTDTMAPHERSQYEHSEIVAGFGMDYNNTAPGPVDMSWAMFRKPNEEEMVENFPSFSSQFMIDSGNVSRSDLSLHAENQRLKDMLEKERYRRKHCEQYIQQLNMKILEIQQQLAVAVSTDKRKDIMIEQLDKQLALVVEGWRKRDAEKDELLNRMQQEKREVENSLQKQQEMIGQFEHDMSEAVEALRQEREKSAQTIDEMKGKIAESERVKSHSEELLSAEREKCELIQQECDNLRESRETLDKKLEQMQRRLHREQDEWFQREQELLQRIEEVGEKNAKILQMEKAKNEEQGKLAEEVVEQLQEANSTVKKLEMELDAALREKESTKVEMGIMEAKFENAQRVLETDLQTQMEKQIAEQIQDVQSRYEKVQDEIREKHKSQILELSQRHSREIEKQLAVFKDELAKKEDDFRKQFQEMETSLLEYRNENSELKLAKQKLESTRLEILTKLQYAMQTQWNEALSLLAATPQRKNPNNTAITEDDSNMSTMSVQPSLSSVSFNLPARSASNKMSDKSLPSQTGSRQGHGSPERSANQDVEFYSRTNETSPTKEPRTNQRSPSKEGDGAMRLDDGTDNEGTVEDTALSHMREFQDYMNRLSETPQWISALTRPGQDSDVQRSVSHDISLLLSTYLTQQPPGDNSQSRQIPLILSSNQSSVNNHQSNHQTSSLPSQPSNQLPFSSYISDSSQNELANQGIGNRQSSHSESIPDSQTTEMVTPPRERNNSYLTRNFTESQFQNNTSNSVVFGGMVQSSSPMYEDSGMSRAVAIRPPQQGEDPYLHDDNESVISSIAGGQMGGFFQGGQCFSPPTRQRRDSFNDSPEDLNRHTSRLNEDYSHLSERVRKHETHQNDLQKYIQMLLGKPQSDSRSSKNESLEHNESTFSQDLDLNDTAQAAQLQKELDRIQELRERQEFGNKTQAKPSVNASVSAPLVNKEDVTGHSKVLNEEQLTEITRLLNAVKDHPQPGNQHIGELLNVLKDVKKDKGNQPEVKRTKIAGDRPKPVTVAAKRNVQFHPGKGVEGTKLNIDNTKQDKSAPRSAQSKKIERKIAGSVSKTDKGPKPAAWK